MTDVNKDLVRPFLGALQACTFVLLTLLYGIKTCQANLINHETINEMSGICVEIFLPALILVKLGSDGSELSLDIASHYVPVFGAFAPPPSHTLGRLKRMVLMVNSMVNPLNTHIDRRRPCLLSLYASTNLGNTSGNIQHYILPPSFVVANIAVNRGPEVDYNAWTVGVGLYESCAVVLFWFGLWHRIRSRMLLGRGC